MTAKGKSYHDVDVFVGDVHYRIADDYSLELTCRRVSGWRLWRNFGSGADERSELLGGEFDGCDFRVEIAGEVVCGSKPSAQPGATAELHILIDHPSKPGWYATLLCWDAREGVFPYAHYWNGEQWLNVPASASLTYFQTEPFSTEEEALTYASDHDPEQ